METSKKDSARAEIRKIMADGRFDRVRKTVETLSGAGVPWWVTMFTVASDVEELAIDLREFDPALEALYEKVDAANATGDQQEIKKADEAWCKRADEIQARVLGWVGLPGARKFLESSRYVYEEMLCLGMLAATRGMPFEGPVRKAVRG